MAWELSSHGSFSQHNLISLLKWASHICDWFLPQELEIVIAPTSITYALKEINLFTMGWETRT